MQQRTPVSRAHLNTPRPAQTSFSLRVYHASAYAASHAPRVQCSHCPVAIVAHTKNQTPFWFAPRREKSGWCEVRPEGTARHCPSTARTRPLIARIAGGSEVGCGTGTRWWKTLQEGSHVKHTCDVSQRKDPTWDLNSKSGAQATFLVVHARADDIEWVVDNRDLVGQQSPGGWG